MKGRYIGALFVDVKAASPTVNPLRLTKTLSKKGFPAGLVKLILSYLTHRSTTIAFWNFESEPKNIAIGPPQGSPLLVIFMFSTILPF